MISQGSADCAHDRFVLTKFGMRQAAFAQLIGELGQSLSVRHDERDHADMEGVTVDADVVDEVAEAQSRLDLDRWDSRGKVQ